MILLAALGTTVKQGISCMLLLGACLGWGVHKANLDAGVWSKMVLLTVAFIATESFRVFKLLSQDRVHEPNNSTVEVLYTLRCGLEWSYYS